MSGGRLEGLLTRGIRVLPHERRAVILAFTCNFLVLGSYYILRPVRDTIATVFGTDQLQWLFTGTFIGTLIASPIYGWLAARIRLNRLLPGVFWFWLVNVVLFQMLFKLAPENRWIGGAYYVWFSVVNLFMISVFWTLMSDLFSASQATRLFALIAAGGTLDVGFVIGGSTAKTVLVRVGGPALKTLYGVAGVMPDPQLQVSPLKSSTTVLAFNAGWGGNAEIASVASSVGAYAFPNASSLDSAALVTLPPGPYTVQVNGTSGDGGTVLVEIYDVP